MYFDTRVFCDTLISILIITQLYDYILSFILAHSIIYIPTGYDQVKFTMVALSNRVMDRQRCV